MENQNITDSSLGNDMPSITIDFIEGHPDKSWGWREYGCSSSSAITIELIKEHPDKLWEWEMCDPPSNCEPAKGE